jgi:NAD(P)-dependent dehydrogenase (short-subunit alcohol dehydrogenase family)
VFERTVLITGATGGLGRYLAQRLAQRGDHVLLHGRSRERAERERAEIVEATGNDRVDVLVADLASLREVDRLADEVAGRYDRLDVLVNNAGVGTGEPGAPREESADGIELRFAVNYLAGYHLGRRLTPLLIAAAPSRVIAVSSAGQAPIAFDDPLLRSDYDGITAYCQSKLAQIMFTFDLADELAEYGVTVNALHPATYMDTPMVRRAGVSPRSSIDEGGEATLRLIVDPALDGHTGAYFDGTRERRAHEQAYQPEARVRLRELSDRLVADALS